MFARLYASMVMSLWTLNAFVLLILGPIFLILKKNKKFRRLYDMVDTARPLASAYRYTLRPSVPLKKKEALISSFDGNGEGGLLALEMLIKHFEKQKLSPKNPDRDKVIALLKKKALQLDKDIKKEAALNAHPSEGTAGSESN